MFKDVFPWPNVPFDRIIYHRKAKKSEWEAQDMTSYLQLKWHILPSLPQRSIRSCERFLLLNDTPNFDRDK